MKSQYVYRFPRNEIHYIRCAIIQSFPTRNILVSPVMADNIVTSLYCSGIVVLFFIF